MKYEIRNRQKKNLISYLLSQKSRGLTLIELLVVVSILAVLFILAVLTFGMQRQRGRDAQRKSDLAKLKVVFEDYYNDHRCYPTSEMMSHCNQGDLRPYMDKVPCDPVSNLPYGYVVDSACSYWGVFTTLQITDDPIIAQSGCSPTCGGGHSYNYGITNSGQSLSSLASQIESGGSQEEEQEEEEELGGGEYACSPSGVCNIYSNPSQSGCPMTFADPEVCQQACSNLSNRCAQ